MTKDEEFDMYRTGVIRSSDGKPMVIGNDFAQDVLKGDTGHCYKCGCSDGRFCGKGGNSLLCPN